MELFEPWENPVPSPRSPFRFRRWQRLTIVAAALALAIAFLRARVAIAPMPPCVWLATLPAPHPLPERAASPTELEQMRDRLQRHLDRCATALNLSELSGLSETYERETTALKYRTFQQRHREIELRLQAEARYRNHLIEAKEMADRAIALIDGRNIPRKDWQESERLWQQVLALLEEIPENSFSRDLAAPMLLRYRQNLAFVREQMQKFAAESP